MKLNDVKVKQSNNYITVFMFSCSVVEVLKLLNGCWKWNTIFIHSPADWVVVEFEHLHLALSSGKSDSVV